MTEKLSAAIDAAVRRGAATKQQPTLAEIREWPATCSVPAAASAIGCSATHLAALIRAGVSPVTTVPLGTSKRQIVITASLVRLLSGEDRGAA